MPASSYPQIREPLTLGPRTLVNRIAVMAHSYNFSVEGQPTDKLIDYVAARVRGEVGMIVLGETYVTAEPAGGSELWGATLSTDGIEDFYERLMSVCAQAGPTVIVEQLSHPGGQAWPEPGTSAYAPSRVAHAVSGLMPREMSTREIKSSVLAFAAAARRVSAGGVHGVELKADQGKLHHQFLSPYFNRRDDLYGSSPIAGIRFLRETLTAIREVDGELLLGLRLPGDTFPRRYARPHDLDMDATLLIGQAVLAEGLVDYISISGATNSDPRGYWHSHGDPSLPPDTFAELARTVREQLDVPLVVSGRVLTVNAAEALLNSGVADVIGMTRATIADAAIVRKSLAGELGSVRPCIGCNQSCVGHTWEGRELRCIHNASAGNEARFADMPRRIASFSRRRVIVIGGGVAGLEAARVAGQAGLSVTLHEASRSLGGQILTASKAAERSTLIGAIVYLKAQIDLMSDVTVRLDSLVNDPATVSRPGDLVLIATGALAQPTAGLELTVDALPVLDVGEALTRDDWQGKTVLVQDEDWRLGGLAGALTLARRGARVSLATRQEFAGKGLDLVTLTSLHSYLGVFDPALHPWTELVAIEGETVILRHTLTGIITERDDFDVVVTAFTYNPRRPARCDGATNEWKIVGDALFPRGIEHATYDSNLILSDIVRSHGKND